MPTTHRHNTAWVPSPGHGGGAACIPRTKCQDKHTRPKAAGTPIGDPAKQQKFATQQKTADLPSQKSAFPPPKTNQKGGNPGKPRTQQNKNFVALGKQV